MNRQLTVKDMEVTLNSLIIKKKVNENHTEKGVLPNRL
jgi:hypothetical protein